MQRPFIQTILYLNHRCAIILLLLIRILYCLIFHSIDRQTFVVYIVAEKEIEKVEPIVFLRAGYGRYHVQSNGREHQQDQINKLTFHITWTDDEY